MKRYNKVPPTAALRGFEATVRLGSVSAAAEELALTQSAVSHQLRLLEEHVGQPLFLRAGRELRPSDAGRDYYRSVREALDRLEGGLLRLEPYRKADSIVIYAPADFIGGFAVGALAAFRAAHPTVDPWFADTPADPSFDTVEVDISVTRGEKPPADGVVLECGRDLLTPVMAPALAARVREPADLLALPLIHDERRERWDDWFRHVGVAARPAVAGPNFSGSAFAQAAAEHGVGVALGSLHLAGPALAAGRLVAPFEATLACRESWWAATRPALLRDEAVAAVWFWLRDRFAARAPAAVSPPTAPPPGP